MTSFEFFASIALIMLCYVLGQTRLAVRRLTEAMPSIVKRSFPDCDHQNWHIDTQLKLMWCDKCKHGRWYQIANIEGAKITIKE
mgnify:CR=1 FL=1|jgi:hypothetical protein